MIRPLPTGAADARHPGRARLTPCRWAVGRRRCRARTRHGLDRATGTLSGGESQRTNLIRDLGSRLTDETYVFGEPTTGLHPHDVQRRDDLLLRLRDEGNTVLVVEHEPETIAIADHVVDLAPGARERVVRSASRAPSRGCAPAGR